MSRKRAEPTIYLKDGKWYTRFWDHTGKQKRQPTGYSQGQRKEAERFLALAVAQDQRLAERRPQGPIDEEDCNTWFKRWHETRKNMVTWHKQAKTWEKYFEKQIGHLKPSEVTTEIFLSRIIEPNRRDLLIDRKELRKPYKAFWSNEELAALEARCKEVGQTGKGLSLDWSVWEPLGKAASRGRAVVSKYFHGDIGVCAEVAAKWDEVLGLPPGTVPTGKWTPEQAAAVAAHVTRWAGKPATFTDGWQSAIAEKANISRGSLRQALLGAQNIKESGAKRLAEVLGIELDAIPHSRELPGLHGTSLTTLFALGQGFFQYLVEPPVRLLPVNPVSVKWSKHGVVGYHADPHFKARQGKPTPRSDVEKLIYDLRRPAHSRVLAGLKFFLACRHVDVSNLRWFNLDRERKPLPCFVLTVTKGGDKHDPKERELPLLPAALEIVDWWWNEGWEQQYGRKPRREDLVLPHPARPEVVCPNDTTKWKLEERQVGIEEHRGGHRLRSAFLEQSCEDGADGIVVDKILHTIDDTDLVAKYGAYSYTRRCQEASKLQMGQVRGRWSKRGLRLVPSPGEGGADDLIEPPAPEEADEKVVLFAVGEEGPGNPCEAGEVVSASTRPGAPGGASPIGTKSVLADPSTPQTRILAGNFPASAADRGTGT